MKKHLNLRNLLIIANALCVCYLVYDYWQYSKFVSKVEAINKRIDYLHEVKGYSVLEAKHISDVEFGLCPSDAEYNALIKE